AAGSVGCAGGPGETPWARSGAAETQRSPAVARREGRDFMGLKGSIVGDGNDSFFFARHAPGDGRVGGGILPRHRVDDGLADAPSRRSIAQHHIAVVL